MTRRWKNNSGVEQVVYLEPGYRSWPTHIASGGLIEAKDAFQESILSSVAESGRLSEIPRIPDQSALHFVLQAVSPIPGQQVPALKNVSRREVVFHDQHGAVVASVLPSASIAGWQYLRYRRPSGPLRWMNRFPTPLEVTLTTEAVEIKKLREPAERQEFDDREARNKTMERKFKNDTNCLQRFYPPWRARYWDDNVDLQPGELITARTDEEAAFWALAAGAKGPLVEVTE